jgi:hypothetical protein
VYTFSLRPWFFGKVGGLFTQIWFPCMTTEPVEIITVNIGPETGYGTGTHDTNFFVRFPYCIL